MASRLNRTPPSDIFVDLSRLGVPGVRMFGRYRHIRAEGGLRDHTHPGAIEICFLVKGRQTYRVKGKDYCMTGGDIFMTYPGEVHSSAGLPQEKGILYWLTLQEPSEGIDLLNLPPAQGKALFRSIRHTRYRHFRGSWQMKDHLDLVASLAVKRRSHMRGFAMTNAVGAFLLELVNCAEIRQQRLVPGSLRPVLNFIEENIDAPLSVPELATRAGLSVSRFKARFKEEMGVPPGEYVLRARIKEAERRLVHGQTTITEVAYDLGFSSSQYFATVFKRFTRKRPSELSGGRLRPRPPDARDR